MLTVPSIHPFLMALLAGRQPVKVPDDAWQTIVEEAVTQRVAPLLLRWLSRSLLGQEIPLYWLTALKEHVARHAAWHLVLIQELREILATCTQQNIICVPLRGPVLTEHLYGDSWTRPMDDLDLLVHREDLSVIKDIFRHLHYAHYEHRCGFQEAYSYSLEFVHPQYGLVVEPHWTLAYPPMRDLHAMTSVWARTKKNQWMAIDTWMLSHEDLLLHLCLHLHHKGHHAPLLWFHELATLIRRHESTIDWSIFINQVQLMEQTGTVYDVLATVAETFHSPVPTSVTKQLAAHRHNASLSSALIVPDRILAQSSLSGREELAVLCSLESLPQQLQYFSAFIFPSPQYMRRRYGASSRMRLIANYIARFFFIGTECLRWVSAWIGAVLAMRLRSFIHR
jgi:hypothetical protein